MNIDHVDSRVRDVRAVEQFYDALMPRLGFARKTYARVTGDEWAPSAADADYNTVEYYEEAADGMRGAFFGVIEDPGHVASRTRVAFRVPSRDALHELASRLASFGARAVDPSDDLDAYPAYFFEDPLGTKLEIIAPRAASTPAYPAG